MNLTQLTRGDRVAVHVARRNNATLTTSNLATTPLPRIEEAIMEVLSVDAMGQITLRDEQGNQHTLGSSHILRRVA